VRLLGLQDAAWLALESQDTPMHIGGLYEFTLPEDAPSDFLREEFRRMRAHQRIPAPWNLQLVRPPLARSRLPIMREIRDVDLDHHIRHSALPRPGGQRELGELVSRLHSNQLDLRRPLWEVHLIEGLEHNRFAIYNKVHHSLLDGVSGMRLITRALSSDPTRRGMEWFWTTGAGPAERSDPAPAQDRGAVDALTGAAEGLVSNLAGVGRLALSYGRSRLAGGPLQLPYSSPRSLGGPLERHRRFATQSYRLDELKACAKASGSSLNEIVLYLVGSALRRYLAEHASVPNGSLTAGIPVSLRRPGDQTTGTDLSFIVADLGTNVADPLERLEIIKRSSGEAKTQLRNLPIKGRASQTIVVNGPYIVGLLAGLGHRSPAPFSLPVSNVPGPSEHLYCNGARLDAVFPVSLLTHGNALNITCISYADTVNFGLTGARNSIPHLQRIAVSMGDALGELKEALRLGDEQVDDRDDPDDHDHEP
jgi:diacylglycerol O-acyltransferase / wax synthase